MSNFKFQILRQRRMRLGRTNFKSGQGLLEIIVAIGVLSTGVFSAVALMTSSLNATKENEARLLGSNLAREGIEAVRAIRDSNWLSSSVWDTGLEGVGGDYTGIVFFDWTNGNWSMDFTANDITGESAVVLRLEDGLAVQIPPSVSAPPVEETLYRRLITVNPLCYDQATRLFSVIESGICPDKKAGIEVNSMVEWSVGPRARRASFVENMYDWR